MHMVALIWWVLEKTGSGLTMATIMIFQAIPMLLFVLFGGVVVDRFDKLEIMIVSDAARAVVTGVMAFLAYGGALEIWHVYIAAAVFGFVDAFFQPAYLTTVPKLARKEDLASANALTSVGSRIMRVAGPTLGALCVSQAGTSFVFALDALSYVISIGFLIDVIRTLRREPPEWEDQLTGLGNSLDGLTTIGGNLSPLGGAMAMMRPEDLKQNSAGKSRLREVIDDTRAGFKFVFTRVQLWMPMVVFCLINAFDYSAFMLAFPYLITRVLELDIVAFAILQSMSAVGFALIAIILGQRTRLRKRGALLFAGVVAVGVSSLGIAAPITIYGVAGFVVVRAMGYSVLELTVLDVFQTRVPADRLGRVFAIYSFLSMVLLLVGLASIGWMTELLDPRVIFISVGLLLLVISLGFRHPKIRKLN